MWGFNVGEDCVALTENFVRDGKDGVPNLAVGGVPVVASWDPEAQSLGIWYRSSNEPIFNAAVNVHGRVVAAHNNDNEENPLERVETVKNGAFWSVYANFFPQARVNPMK